VLNDLAEAMKVLDGKKHARRALCTWAGLGTDPGDDGRTVGGHLLGDPF